MTDQSLSQPRLRFPSLAPTEDRIAAILAKADVVIGGNRPWDIEVRNWRFYSRVARDGAAGVGDSYVEGWWECEAIDQLFDRLLRNSAEQELKWTWPNVRDWAFDHLLNKQNPVRALFNVRAHYDLGNDLYRAMLDPMMIYSCGYWKNAKTLAEAQHAKLDLICRKLQLESGMSLLDIGCGWGGLAKFAAENYGVRVTGITLSRQQLQQARETCKGLPIKLHLQDYRTVTGNFDRIVSVGMIEHVGQKNYHTFMKVAANRLADHGLFLLHNFGSPYPSPTLRQPEVGWVERHIFPGLVLPSIGQLEKAADGLLATHDVHEFGRYYDPTLMAWFENFDHHWPSLREKYGDRFYRLWKYYLLCGAGSFRSGKFPLWQFVYSRPGRWGEYEPAR